MSDSFEGEDREWIGCDARGCLAVFTVASGEPIPDSLRTRDLLDLVSKTIWKLPVCTTAAFTASLPRPDDYVAFAKRGLFSYDWTDFHRRQVDCIRRYEMMSCPAVPRLASDIALPDELRRLIPVFSSIAFAESKQIEIPAGWNASVLRAKTGA